MTSTGSTGSSQRDFLLGWHQDDDHPEHGEVHLQLNQSDSVVARMRAKFLDEHPMTVVEARLEQLPAVVNTLTWENGSVTELDW